MMDLALHIASYALAAVAFVRLWTVIVTPLRRLHAVPAETPSQALDRIRRSRAR